MSLLELIIRIAVWPIRLIAALIMLAISPILLVFRSINTLDVDNDDVLEAIEIIFKVVVTLLKV